MDRRPPLAFAPVVAHWLKFNTVGLAGILIQSVVLAFLANVVGLHYLLATVVAVEAAVLHNFVWHRRWTWADRRQAGAVSTLLAFNFTTGAVSIAGNLLFMWLLVGGAKMNASAANLLTIALCSVLNFMLSDQIVFRASRTVRGTSPQQSCPAKRGRLAKTAHPDYANPTEPKC
ncbi:MAG TPA: GtrA family protein [Blastocatellia bacterium]|nr:GtrA family protein [Blastocatellia bacterium]